MIIETGVIFAFIAMIGWGFGDFFIQKSTRKIGVWTTVFIITLIGFIVLTPFALKNAASLFTFGRNIFLIGAVAYFIAAFLDLEALREGKLDIVEPIWSLEIVSASALAYFLLGEAISSFLKPSISLSCFSKSGFSNSIIELKSTTLTDSASSTIPKSALSKISNIA